jgi:hypothetical protein
MPQAAEPLLIDTTLADAGYDAEHSRVSPLDPDAPGMTPSRPRFAGFAVGAAEPQDPLPGSFVATDTPRGIEP